MKIVHVITRMIIGGAQENTLYNCLDLARDFGDEVTLLTGPTTGPEGQLLEGLSEEARQSIRIEVIPTLRRSIHPLDDRRALLAISSAIKQIRPDVVHTHSAKAGFLGRLAAWRLQVPAVVHTVHGAPFHEYQNRGSYWLFRWLEWHAAKHCHHMISVADAMTDLMVAARVARREKFTTIYSGMEVQPFLEAFQQRAATRREWNFQEKDLVVGKIARLAPLKGHEYLLQSAIAVIQQNPRVKFFLVGNGTKTEEIKREIDRLGLSDHFVLTGLVAPRQIPSLISAMDVVVHTSLREGLARVLPQALLAGVPVVSFDIDGAREVCVDGETGGLVAPRDTTGLTQCLLRLAGDAELRSRLGRAGQDRCRQVFDHHYMTEKIREVYRQVLR
ncbi:MAG: glycosyltransferase family 4 protein [Planctomycetaceae bacterium]|nr:glycosyltransferase family 4 protein [Planctomycetaceae bacterium]